jgi:hypothetical protein
MNRHVLRGLNAQADLVAANVDNRDHDVVADHDALVTVPRQNQHPWLLPHALSPSRATDEAGA